MKKLRGGFSLFELILASALMCVVLIAMLSVQAFVLRGQQKNWRIQKISSDAVYATDSITSALRGAGVGVSEPAATGMPSTRLLVYVYPTYGQSTYFLYCFQDTTGELYKYSGPLPPPLSFTPFWCGKPPSWPTTRETVISGFKNAVVTFLFTRNPQNSNAVNINYSIKYHGEELKGYTSVSMQRSL